MMWKKPSFWNTESKKFKQVYTDPVIRQNRIYTQDIAVSLDRKKTRRNGHAFLLTSGREAYQWLYVNILQANSNYVIPDFNGEVYHDTHQYLRDNGYQVHVLNIDNPAEGMHYNPITCMQLYGDSYTESIENTISTMLYRHKAADPFKYKTSETLLRAMLHYVKNLPEEQQTIETLKSLMPDSKIEKRNPWDGGVMRATSQSYMVQHCLDVLRHVPGVMLLEAALDVYTALSYVDMMSTDSEAFDMTQLTSGKHVVYLNYGNPAWHKEIISLFYTQLLDVLYSAAENSKTHQLDENWLFFADQWHYDLARRLATSSKYNINFAVHARMLSELKYTYPDEWECILSNCDVLLYAPGIGCNETDYMTRCLRSVEKPGVSNEGIVKLELSKITPEQCVVCVRGLKPFLCTKYSWQQHPNAMELPQRGGEVV